MMPKNTKAVNTMTGQNIRPRTNRQAGSTSARSSQPAVVTAATTSSGERISRSSTNRTDSRLERLARNGHHPVVTVSPMRPRKSIRYTPMTGRRNAATHVTTSSSSASG